MTAAGVLVDSPAPVAERGSTRMEYPRDRALHSLVEEQAARTPGAVAVEFEGRTLTYAELDRRASALADRLRAAGVGPEVRVGIFVERSPEMLVALLGTLKAGGAYLPLDPAYPAERIGYILQDAAAPVLLTQEGLSAALPELEARVLLVGDEEHAGGERAPGAQVDPESAAYVIYTSGSTGRPKGVVVPHRAVVNFLHTMRREPGLSAEDVLLAVTTLSFDIAGLELFLPLTVGARVVIASRETASDARLLAEALTQCGATVLQATPATWRLLLAGGWAGNPRLRALCGGEALDGELARRVAPLVKELWNLYGPTETTIWSTVHAVDGRGGTPPIGRPVGNTRTYLLDSALDVVPLGTEGELYIAGDGVARGYLHRPELTAERFLPEPGGAPGDRMYRTGDVARQRPDGTLEYLGRVDFQVKVRGFRIELGEIEAALAALPAVAQAVVTARRDAPGDHRLVAYLTATGELPEPAGLRAALQETLPEYMVPAAFVRLDAFPLTPNGKVDRKALPAPDAVRTLRAREYVAPRTSLESVLAWTWAEVLGTERVGMHDDFFELGGHSLSATQVLARLEVLKVKLPPRALFDAPTVERLARLILSNEEIPGRTEMIAGILKKVKGMSGEERREALQARHAAGGET